VIVRVLHGVRDAKAMAERGGLQDGLGQSCKEEETAETDVFHGPAATIPPEDWDAFAAWINRPPEVIPGLAERIRRMPSWED
jgi:hypothetical protein